MRFELAEEMAAQVKPEKGMRVYAIISGRFIAGDFIEAWILTHKIPVKKLTIVTLSMSEANVDSLKNLMVSGYVQNIELLVSDYFYAHERQNLVPYIYQQLDTDNRFQMAACGSHCKVALIETEKGNKVVLHGSANLRSSGNIEQFCIEENESLFDFNATIFSAIIEKYATIRKTIRHSNLWESINNQQHGIRQQNRQG